MRAFTLIAMLITTLTAACGPSTRDDHPPISEDSYPWQWRDLAELPGDFLWQQSIDAKLGAHSFHLEAALQKKDGQLVLVGLTPFGSKAFALTQQGTSVSFESFVDRKPPFPPKFMLVDVQRAYWPIAPATADGAVATELGAEHVDEVFAGGHLVSRTFTRAELRPDGKPYPGAITIRYDDWQDDVARRVTITNDWFGYTMDIRTTSAKTL